MKLSILTILIFSSISLMPGCASLPTDIKKTTSFAYQDTHVTRLGKVTAALGKGKKFGTGVLPLASGIDAFTARYILAKNAERSIDVQYYLWHNDTTGKLLMYALLQAANRGVRVRILLDDIDTAEKDIELLTLHKHKNIEVRLFNPFPNRNFRIFDIITDFFRINRRMHNKSFTVDNMLTIVGGRNIGDEYFDAKPSLGFHDFDVLAVGDVVNDVSVQFDKYWNYKRAIPVNALSIYEEQDVAKLLKAELEDFFVKSYKTPYVQAVKKSGFIKKLEQRKLKLYWDKAKVIYDPPEKVEPEDNDPSKYLLPKLVSYLDKTQEEVIFISPYFIPGRGGIKKLKSLTKRGVLVKVLTNSLASTDVPIVYSGYAPYRIPLLESKVELHEIKTTARMHIDQAKSKKRSITSSSRSSLHSKIYIFDRSNLLIGSLNLDPRSSKLNTEMGIMIYNTDLAVKMSEWWDNQINNVAYKLNVEYVEDEYEVESYLYWEDLSVNPVKRYDEPPRADFFQKIGSDIFSILPIEDHL